MGLDATLIGEIYNSQEQYDQDGYRILGTRIRLASWRNQQHLHELITDLSPDSLGSMLELDQSDLETITKAIQKSSHDDYADEEERQHDLETFRKAINWVSSANEGEYRYITYQASW